MTLSLINAFRTRPRSCQPSMSLEMRNLARATLGFLTEEEGLKLFDLACELSPLGPCVEIGTYCGKSAVYLGEGCRTARGYGLFCVDHHRGSVEQQPGQAYFDSAVYDAQRDVVDTLPLLQDTITRADLDEWIIPIVTGSTTAARNWLGPAFSLVFIDGGHSKENVQADFQAWSKLILRGGTLCFHDIYPDPSTGGQAPREVFEAASATPEWRFENLTGSLGVLRRR